MIILMFSLESYVSDFYKTADKSKNLKTFLRLVLFQYISESIFPEYTNFEVDTLPKFYKKTFFLDTMKVKKYFTHSTYVKRLCFRIPLSN